LKQFIMLWVALVVITWGIPASVSAENFVAQDRYQFQVNIPSTFQMRNDEAEKYHLPIVLRPQKADDQSGVFISVLVQGKEGQSATTIESITAKALETVKKIFPEDTIRAEPQDEALLNFSKNKPLHYSIFEYSGFTDGTYKVLAVYVEFPRVFCTIGYSVEDPDCYPRYYQDFLKIVSSLSPVE